MVKSKKFGVRTSSTPYKVQVIVPSRVRRTVYFKSKKEANSVAKKWRKQGKELDRGSRQDKIRVSKIKKRVKSLKSRRRET